MPPVSKRALVGVAALVGGALFIAAAAWSGRLAAPVVGAVTEEHEVAMSPMPTTLLQGVMAASQQGKATALTAEFETRGNTNSVNIYVCETEESLARTLEINVEASASAMGIASASLKTEYLKTLRMKTYNLAVVVRAVRDEGMQSLVTAPKIKPGAAPDDSQESVEAFYSQFGDSFVDSIVLGSALYITYKFETASLDDQQSLKAKLEAEGVFKGITARMDLGAAINRVHQESGYTVEFHPTAIGSKPRRTITMDNMMEEALSFNEWPRMPPTVLKYSTRGYETVEGLANNTWMQKLARCRDIFAGAPALEERGLLQELTKVMAVEEAALHIQETYRAYGLEPEEFDPDLNKALAQADAQRQVARRLVQTYLNYPFEPFERPEMSMATVGVPVLQWVVRKTMSCGGNGGDRWSDVDEFGGVAHMLSRRARLIKVGFTARTLDGERLFDPDRLFIGEIVTTYKEERADPTAFKRGRCSQGRPGPSRELDLYKQGSGMATVVRIRVVYRPADPTYFGLGIMRLEMQSGPPKFETQEVGDDDSFDCVFTPPESEGWRLLGFHGRSADMLDALGAVWVKILPASWHFPEG